VILGAVLNPINSSIVAVSLIPVGRASGAPVSHTAWLVSALYLATAIGQPVVGRLVDGYGPRRLFLAGTALVGIALFAVTLTALLALLMDIRPGRLFLLAVVAAGGAGFAARELRTAEPCMPLLGRGSPIRLLVAIAAILGVPQGLNNLAVFLIVVAALFVAPTAADRSLARVGATLNPRSRT
jgi:MFS family permease